MASCRIMTSNPTVMAEMVFPEKHIAENVIQTFNNQKADGRILHVYMHRTGPFAAPIKNKSEPALFVSDPLPTPAPKELIGNENGAVEGGGGGDNDVDMGEESGYTDSRQAADQDRRERESLRAEVDVQDGRYGFGGRDERSNVESQQSSSTEPKAETRDTRIIDRDITDRRDDGRDRRYDSGAYQRRDGTASYRRDDRFGNYGRGDRPSHYGNQVGGRGYGSEDRYGRMYSDEMMRDRPRGPRGGQRGYR